MYYLSGHFDRKHNMVRIYYALYESVLDLVSSDGARLLMHLSERFGYYKEMLLEALLVQVCSATE